MSESADITIPRPVHVVLDDVGWREGGNLSDTGGPYRAGVDRIFDEADYLAVVELGERLNIRPQCAMILCEWDRQNVCAQYPTTTPAGAKWDNSARVGDWAFRARDVFINRAANIEFALHGVGHEHWDNGVVSRAEWHGRGGRRWPREVLDAHIECYRKILAQYGLDPASGMSFPPAFVPCAYAYYWDDADPQSTGALMETAGVRYASLVFKGFCTFAGGPPEKPDGGFDHGLLVLDRDNTVAWQAFASVPESMPATSICGLHWPNLLMPDPARNNESVAMWTEYLSRVASQDDLMLAANTAEAWSQWVYRNFASIRRENGRWILDATRLPARALPFAESPILKIRLPAGAHVAAVQSDDCRTIAYWEHGGFGFLRLKFDQSCPATFNIQFGSPPLPLVVMRSGTFDTLDLRQESSQVQVHVRMYGTQTVSIRLPFAPSNISADTAGIQIKNWSFDGNSRLAKITIAARDIHGQAGTIIIHSSR
ncbi:MAG: hypothetical protein HZA50_13940 [Planctomycetes bacterium]|nr:hypothetical protein [Planctomycetota bacterium]